MAEASERGLPFSSGCAEKGAGGRGGTEEGKEKPPTTHLGGGEREGDRSSGTGFRRRLRHTRTACDPRHYLRPQHARKTNTNNSDRRTVLLWSTSTLVPPFRSVVAGNALGLFQSRGRCQEICELASL
jgi:hypothetical protein